MDEIFKRRSIRKYLNQPVKSEKIDKLLRAATENLLLEAVHLRLGGVWMAAEPMADRALCLRTMFDLPDHIKPFCIISIGYSTNDQQNSFVDRRDQKRIHYENY